MNRESPPREVAQPTRRSLEELIQGCESEQLHLSGAIQAWGACLWWGAGSGRITHASANIERYLPGASAESWLQREVASVPWIAAHSGLLERTPGSVAERMLDSRDGAEVRLIARFIRGENGVAIELEQDAPLDPLHDAHAMQGPLMYVPEDDRALADYGDLLLDSIVRLTGFDRVMLYRFHPDWSGEVIAERTTPALGSYRGLRFPASDIPAIARRLYLINPCRMIADARAVPVPMLSRQPEPPDLTWSDLRSVSPVHLQYLANMGVAASFSVPIRVAGKLWGLVACHHLQPRCIPAAARKGCAALCAAYALGLSSHLAGQRMRLVDSLERRVDHVLEEVARHENPLDGVESAGESLRQALRADGFAMVVGEDAALFGETPALEALGPIDRWFVDAWDEPLFATEQLGEYFPGNPLLLSVASGLMAIKAHSPRSGMIRFYWFRPEEPSRITWAGNPNKPQPENASAIMLSPRRSFEHWVEVRTGHSRPWLSEERMVAAKFRNYLLRWL